MSWRKVGEKGEGKAARELLLVADPVVGSFGCVWQ
jgi:hypothetical protein